MLGIPFSPLLEVSVCVYILVVNTVLGAHVYLWLIHCFINTYMQGIVGLLSFSLLYTSYV